MTVASSTSFTRLNKWQLSLFPIHWRDRADRDAVGARGTRATMMPAPMRKTFSGATSGKFINGVLGTVYKQLGGEEEPEKK